jgi:hypothetical protein
MKMKIKYLMLAFMMLLASCNRENHFKLRQVGNNYVQHYAWWYNDQLYNINLEFPVAEYWHYRNQSKTLPYGNYAQEDKTFEYLKYVSEELNKLVANKHFNDLEMTNFVLAFAQQGIPYVSDPIGPTDYPRFPIETLADGGGDCEDKAALVAAILLTYNIKSVLIQVPRHEAVAVACSECDGYCINYRNTRYFIAETTCPSWRLGDEPDIIKYAKKITVLPVQRTASFNRFGQSRLASSDKRKPLSQTPSANGNNSRILVHIVHKKYSITITKTI